MFPSCGHGQERGSHDPGVQRRRRAKGEIGAASQGSAEQGEGSVGGHTPQAQICLHRPQGLGQAL